MIYRFGNKKPSISKSVFIAETACIIGDVSIGEGSSVWFNSVIRGDMVVMGIPCKEVRKTNEEDIEIIENTLRNYKKLTEEYLKMKG
jgi:carbonic anhydrase/acetyltransferase-like protein (isoleucine patch superfamily)